MNRNTYLPILITCGAVMLSGCSSINKVTQDIGVNFWSKTARKAPCKAAAMVSAEENSELPCLGKTLPKPSDEETIKLRGRYTI